MNIVPHNSHAGKILPDNLPKRIQFIPSIYVFGIFINYLLTNFIKKYTSVFLFKSSVPGWANWIMEQYNIYLNCTDTYKSYDSHAF